MDDARRAGLTELLARLDLPAPASGLELVDVALTHRSWGVEHGSAADNERLEFMGDAVISLATTEYLFETRPDEQEGELSKLRATMVSRRILGEIATGLGLGALLRLGAGEESGGGRERQSILGSALEALCAALYLAYPWDVLREALRRHLILPAMALAEARLIADYKSLLQEWTQKNLQSVPQYAVKEATGPDHRREFLVEVSFAGETWAVGRGTRIKLAENDAAKAALDRIARRSEAEDE